jgi:hypothetical protein
LQCSRKKLKLAWRELITKEEKRMASPPKQVRHTHEENTDDSFCKLLLLPAESDVRAIPSGFVHCFECECPKKIKLKVSSGCIWDVDL